MISIQIIFGKERKNRGREGEGKEEERGGKKKGMREKEEEAGEEKVRQNLQGLNAEWKLARS